MLKIATYNIHGGVGMDRKLDFRRIADVLRPFQADFICLNEVDVNCVRTACRDTPRELQSLLGMDVHFACALELKAPAWPEQQDRIGLYGNAMLTPHPFKIIRELHLPGTPAMEPRLCTIARIEHPAQPFLAAFTHFCDKEPEEEYRVQSARAVSDAVRELAGDRPSVLCGDLNAEPGAPSITELRKDWLLHGDADGGWPKTWPADQPRQSLDYIGLFAANRTLAFHRVAVGTETVASDHRPLFAEITFHA